jgi:hypothetical protein
VSTVTYAAPVSLDLPPPRPFPYHLLTVAEELSVSLDGEGGFDPHWRAGIDIWPYPPDLAFGIDPCATDGSDVKDEGDAIERAVFGAFTIYQPIVCSTLGIRDLAELERRANAALVAHEANAVERQLAGRAFKFDNPFLADANMDPLAAGAATAPKEALALLVEVIGETGESGVIHATPGTIVAWSVLGNALVRERDRLYTLGGIPVVQGTGYQGIEPVENPGSATAVREWAFATGPIGYRRSEEIFDPETFSALERETNRIVYRAELDYLVVWDLGLQAGVLVDRSI